MRQAHSVAFDKRIDWVATLANLRALHNELHHDAAEFVRVPKNVRDALAEIHETVHALAQSLGAPDDWLDG